MGRFDNSKSGDKIFYKHLFEFMLKVLLAKDFRT